MTSVAKGAGLLGKMESNWSGGSKLSNGKTGTEVAILTTYAAFALPASGDQPLAGGRNTAPITLSVTGLADAYAGSVANNTTVTLWDSSVSPVSAFAWCWIKADQDVLIEYQGGSAANNSTRRVRSGFPEIQSTGSMLTYAAGGSFGGSTQAVTKVLLRNASSSTANVKAYFVS